MNRLLWVMTWAAIMAWPSVGTHAAEADTLSFVWLEGEQPASTNLKPKLEGWGKKEYLSGQAWASVSIPADKVDAELPTDGGLIEYAFKIEKAGEHEVWARIGYEFVRSPFDWRIDESDWKRVEPNELTTDLMEVDVWCEVAWLKIGAAKLSDGAHKLHFRLPKTQDEKGKTARVLFALDAICISNGPFEPNGAFKPGQDWRTDRDREAAKAVFEFPEEKESGKRATLKLAGLWEICRNDERLPSPDVAQPIKDIPAHPVWTGIPVPGDKNQLRHDLVFCHRFWYRTRIKVPASAAGRSFFVEFPQNNLNTTVLVNGVACGFNKNPYARFQIDVTKGIKPGETNELWVGIRDAWYGYSTNPSDPMKLRKKFNLPLEKTGAGFQDLAYPVWNHFQSGMLLTPSLVMAGPAYAADIFPIASISKKELALEVTLKRPAGEKFSGELLCEAVNPKTGEVEKSFAPKPFELDADGESVMKLTEKWENPKLWWPDEPTLYHLRTTVKAGGQTADVLETPFGFREWTSEGKDFKLNGIVWHGWADCFGGKDPNDWLAFYRKTHQRVMRFWGTSWQNLSPDDALSFFDKSGVVVRRSGQLDGEAIGYWAIENDPDLKKESPIKMDLMRNWRDQVVAMVKGERNHPSVMVWSMENEFLYINCINLYGGMMDKFEDETAKTSEAVRAIDPTRFTMVDGGGATKKNTLPVHGDHYVFGGRSGFCNYPALAYEAHPDGGGRGRWNWDQQRPRFIGEDYFAPGINPFDYSYFGGEETFQGKAAARRGEGIVYRMLMEGYRWAGYGAWQFWMGQSDAKDQYGSNAPVAVFCRQWDWTFASGATVKRTMKVFNDTRFDDPISFSYTLNVDGKNIPAETREFKIAPGTAQEFELDLKLPASDKRAEGEWVLTLSVKGAEVFRDVKAVSILPEPRRDAYPNLAGLGEKALLVFDPQGSVAEFLKKLGAPFTPLVDLKALPETGKVLIVGKDALDAKECASTALQAWTVGGRRVIVLEQKNPLRYTAIPADLDAAVNEGRTAFIEDLGHPAMRGLSQKDFFTWGPDEIVYRNAYGKPTRGGKSLIQCHHRLSQSALVEMPVGDGLLVVSQLVTAGKLGENPVAQKVLLNLLDYAAAYKLETRAVSACISGSPGLEKMLGEIGLRFGKAALALDALGENRIAVINASPENLRALAENLPKVEQFTAAGGWIFFNGLTPEGLDDYNKIVGVDHMIRPFRMERVAFPPSKHPLTAGLTAADIVMQSGKRINTWTSDVFLASDVFTYIVDYDDVAPFAKFPDAKYFKYDEEKPENDHDPLNMVNGFVSADSWKYIFSIPLEKGAPHEFPLTWPKEQRIVEFEWVGNAFYHVVTKIGLTMDGDKAKAAVFKAEPNNEPQVFAIEPVIQGRELVIDLAEWDKAGRANVIGVDNIRLKAARSPEFYQRVKPLLNIGAMMAYTKGSGGVVLCQLLFQENEPVPENKAKKKNILATLLRNLKAPFSGGKTVVAVAGAALDYQPVDLSKFGTQYRDERGWFGDKKLTFKDMPFGLQKFAGVPFQIYEFPTSQVPTVIMLAGPNVPNKLPEEVKGIPVGRKADALFFLHTARLDQHRNKKEIDEKKRYEMLRYVVNYADGQSESVPVYAEIDIHDFCQKAPQPIEGAQLAWTNKYEGTDLHAVAYAKQWNNPRPEAEIKSIDIVYGAQKRGVPVVLAITTASAP